LVVQRLRCFMLSQFLQSTSFSKQCVIHLSPLPTEPCPRSEASASFPTEISLPLSPKLSNKVLVNKYDSTQNNVCKSCIYSARILSCMSRGHKGSGFPPSRERRKAAGPAFIWVMSSDTRPLMCHSPEYVSPIPPNTFSQCEGCTEGCFAAHVGIHPVASGSQGVGHVDVGRTPCVTSADVQELTRYWRLARIFSSPFWVEK
jgi:hypothetical protein